MITHCIQACPFLVIFFFRMLSYSHFVHKVTEGKAREEIWLCVNYLFLISTSLICRKNQQVRKNIVWSRDLKGVLGSKMSSMAVV